MMRNPKALSRSLWVAAVTLTLCIAVSGTALAGPSVPELDPGSSASGLALLIGGAVLLLERYRRR